MALTERLALLISANADEALVGFDRLGRKMTLLDGQARRTGLGLGTAVTGGAVLAGVALGKMIHDGVKALEVQQQIDLQTQAVLRSTGSAAGITAKQVGELATSISSYSAFSIDAVKASENVLLSFTAVKDQVGAGNDVFDRATQAVANLSARFGTDLTTTARQLGRALQDPVSGMSALARSGIAFDAQTKKQIKSLAAQGQLLEAQKLLLDAVDKKVAGAAAAAGKGAAGGFAQFHNSLEELDKTLAKPILAPLTQGIHDVADGFKLVNEHPIAVKVVEGIVGIGATAIIASKAIGVLHRVRDSELAAAARGSAARNASTATLAREGAAAEVAATQRRALGVAEAASAGAAEAGSAAHTAAAGAIAREGAAAEVTAAQLKVLATSEALAGGAAAAGAAETGAATAARGLRGRLNGSAAAGLAVFAADAYLVPKAIDSALKVPGLLRANTLGAQISKAIKDYNAGNDTAGQRRALEGIGSQVDAARAAAAKGDFSKLPDAVKNINAALKDNADIYSLAAYNAREYAQNTQLSADAARKSLSDLVAADANARVELAKQASQTGELGDPTVKPAALNASVAAAKTSARSAEDAVTAAEHRIQRLGATRSNALVDAEGALVRAHTTNAVASAEARLARLRSSGGVAAAGALRDAENALARAKERAAAASGRVTAAQNKADTATGLSAKQVLANAQANAANEVATAKGAAKLVRAGVSKDVLNDLINNVEPKAPGTIAKLAASITPALVKGLNTSRSVFDKAYVDLMASPLAASERAGKIAAAKSGATAAKAFIASFRQQMDDARLIIDRDLAPPAGYPKVPKIPTPITSGGQAYDPTHNPLLGGTAPTNNYNFNGPIQGLTIDQVTAAAERATRIRRLAGS